MKSEIVTELAQIFQTLENYRSKHSKEFEVKEWLLLARQTKNLKFLLDEITMRIENEKVFENEI